MACGGFTCSKNALAALNVLYILVAFILIGVATYGKVVALIVSLSILGGIIACGIFLLIVALIGLIGAVKHHQVLLFFYMIILFLIFLIQFSVACACLAIDEEKQTKLAESSWRHSPDATKHQVQKLLGCCGFIEQNGKFNDSMGHPPCMDDVDTCTEEFVCCTGNTSALVPPGNGTQPKCPADPCYNIIRTHMNQAVKTTGGIGLFFSFTEIIGVWLAMRYRNLKDPRANPSAFL